MNSKKDTNGIVPKAFIQSYNDLKKDSLITWMRCSTPSKVLLCLSHHMNYDHMINKGLPYKLLHPGDYKTYHANKPTVQVLTWHNPRYSKLRKHQRPRSLDTKQNGKRCPLSLQVLIKTTPTQITIWRFQRLPIVKILHKAGVQVKKVILQGTLAPQMLCQRKEYSLNSSIHHKI